MSTLCLSRLFHGSAALQRAVERLGGNPLRRASEQGWWHPLVHQVLSCSSGISAVPTFAALSMNYHTTKMRQLRGSGSETAFGCREGVQPFLEDCSGWGNRHRVDRKVWAARRGAGPDSGLQPALITASSWLEHCREFSVYSINSGRRFSCAPAIVQCVKRLRVQPSSPTTALRSAFRNVAWSCLSVTASATAPRAEPQHP